MYINCQIRQYYITSNCILLLLQPISIASARQRAGRAGRTRPGECWRLSKASFWEPHALETTPALSEEPAGAVEPVPATAKAAERTAPEMLRMPLEDVVMKTLQLNLGNPETFLSTCLDAPDLQSIR